MTRLLVRLTLHLIDAVIWLISVSEWCDLRWARMRARMARRGE
jgi:hypothetical protein